jgi:hypothetical protein
MVGGRLLLLLLHYLLLLHQLLLLLHNLLLLLCQMLLLLVCARARQGLLALQSLALLLRVWPRPSTRPLSRRGNAAHVGCSRHAAQCAGGDGCRGYTARP